MKNLLVFIVFVATVLALVFAYALRSVFPDVLVLMVMLAIFYRGLNKINNIRKK